MPNHSNRRRFIQMATGAALAPAASRLPAAKPASARKPNFIILFADDMGYGDLGCYGHPTVKTPNLDGMARQGIRFTSFYAAAPFCTPSRAGLLTGRYPIRAGQPNNLGPDSQGGLPLREITLAQVMKQAGYRTMCIGKWHLGHQPKEYMPTSRGFDSYLGLLYSNDMIPPWVKTKRPLELYRDTEPIEPMKDQSTLTERYTDEAIRFIRSAGDQPFFLYMPYAMPHLPISASGKFRGRSRAGLYGDVVETLDWSVGEILKTLQAQGIDENTMVVFTSDNGPWLDLPERMLQGGVEPWHAGTKNLLRGAKGNTYEGGMREPCIVRWPGVIAADQTTAEMACTLDLFPTIVKAAGATMPTDRVYDGFDLLPMMQGRSRSPRDTFYYCRSVFLEGVREGSWKLRFARHGREELKKDDPITPELFDLDVDPAEQYNVYERNRAVGDRLLKKARNFAAEIQAQLPS